MEGDNTIIAEAGEIVPAWVHRLIDDIQSIKNDIHDINRRLTKAETDIRYVDERLECFRRLC